MAGNKLENSGSLFINDKKSEAKHPDYRGQCRVGGFDYWMAAWIKNGIKGQFMSISFTAQEQNAPPLQKKEFPVPSQAPIQKAGKAEDSNEDIPF